MRKLLILIFFVPCILIGQNDTVFQSDLSTDKKPWTHLDFANDPDNFQFAIVTDRTGSPRAGVFEDAVEKLNWLMPEFVITVGDIIRGASGKDTKKLDKQWKGHFERIAPLKMPFFHLPGNHDIKANNQFQVDYWEDKFGAAYYYFVYKNVLFLCLFSNEGTQVISDEQISYFKEVIGKHSNVRWTMVFMHHPLWRYSHESNFDKIEDLLKDKDYTVFAGHQHRYHHSVRDQKNYYVLATTGGGSELLGNSFGSFDHITWVTMSDEGPILANLRLDGILPHDVANEESQQLTQDLLQSIDVETIVLVDSETDFREGTAYLNYTNVSDETLYINAQFFHNHHVLASPGKIIEEIPPHSSKTIEVKLKGIEPFNLDENVRLELLGSIGYRLEEYPDLSLEGSVFIPVRNSINNLIPTEKAEFVDRFQVSMKKQIPGTEIRYTIDGSDPTANSMKYTGPFEVEKSGVVRARLYNQERNRFSAIDQLELKSVQPGQGLWAEVYTYEQVGKSWRGLNNFTNLSPKVIKATRELDPVKVAERPDRFGLIFKGQISLPETGEYQFKALSDDGIRVLIDGKEVVADPYKHKAREATGTARFEAGNYPIEIQYFQWKRNYAMELSFITPGGKEQKLSTEILSHGK